MRPVIEKELLHYDILYALEQADLLDQLTFQGGTLLRLCYGAQRFSEDLDFTGGQDFASQQLQAMKACLESYLGDRYHLEVKVKEPKVLRTEPNYQRLTVDTWQLSVITAPKHRDLPMQRIKIEVANIPSYSREPKPLQNNYHFLPDGYDDLLIMSQTLDEVMCGKIISLANTQRYIRHRDIWDLRWLKQRGASANIGWIKNKISDYRIENYQAKLVAMSQQLPSIVDGEAFKAQMSRFLPTDVQAHTIQKSKFTHFLGQEISGLLTTVKDKLEA